MLRGMITPGLSPQERTVEEIRVEAELILATLNASGTPNLQFLRRHATKLLEMIVDLGALEGGAK